MVSKWYKSKAFLSVEASKILFETCNELGIDEFSSTKKIKLLCKKAIDLNREINRIKAEFKQFLDETMNFIQEKLPEGSYYSSEYMEKLIQMLKE